MIIEFDRQLLPNPDTSTDEKVVINTPVQGNVGYYQGYILGMSSAQILGTTSTSYGIYSAVAKGGTRYEVIEGGLPTSTQIMIDRTTGRLIANQQITVYVTYPWYARIFHWWETGAKLIQLQNAYINADNALVYEETFAYTEGFVGMELSVPNMVRGTGNATFALRKQGSSTNLATITLIAGQYSAQTIFANRATFSAGDVLNIVATTATGTGIINPVFNLFRG